MAAVKAALLKHGSLAKATVAEGGNYTAEIEEAYGHECHHPLYDW